MPVNKKDISPEHYLPKLKKSFLPTEVLRAALCKRWHLKVLFALEENNDEPMRFSEISKSSDCTSDKMMNQALVTLEESFGLIRKNTIDGKKKYSLTDDGRSLLEVLHQLESWTDEHKREFARKKAGIK